MFSLCWSKWVVFICFCLVALFILQTPVVSPLVIVALVFVVFVGIVVFERYSGCLLEVFFLRDAIKVVIIIDI